MAKMIPDIDPEKINNSGEKAAFKALKKQLPDSWVVRYHYPFCWKEWNQLRDKEIDFIVIAPNLGLMVIEVKGSAGFDCQNGQWFRITSDNKREATENPYDDVTKKKHNLVERIAKKVFLKPKIDFPCTYGHLVMYPSGKIEGQIPCSAEPSLMVAYKDMRNLLKRFSESFAEWKGCSNSNILNKNDMQKIVGFLSDETRGVPVFAADCDLDNERIEQLTQHQFRSFQGLIKGGPRVHVSGPAGSGKTLLARWTADFFARKGEQILLTCYNTVLAEWLLECQPRVGNIQINSFFSLCRSMVLKAQMPFNPPTDPGEEQEFWRSTAPTLFDEAITRLGSTHLQKFDGIIVDEGQDFHPDWWVPLMLMLKDPDHGRLCIFSDFDQQGAYGMGETIPTGLTSYELQDNCRNTRKIATYCGKIIEKTIECSPLLPEGYSPIIEIPIDDVKARAKAIKASYSKLIDQGFDSSRVAILSPLKIGNLNCSLTYLPEMFSLPLKGGKHALLDWKAGRCIWASTIKTFKGLEADCVIVTDCSLDELYGVSSSELYVGTTRAKHQLIILPAKRSDQSRLESFL
jgi:hypothetical protein